MTDFESRYLIVCTALPSTKEALARVVFERAFREFGLPEYIRSDNGVPFSGLNCYLSVRSVPTVVFLWL